MAYLAPAEFVTKMIDAGESKIFMSTRDTLIRAYMAGAILALAAAFAVTINVQTGQPLAGAVLFPVGFCLLYLLGFDLLTGVFTLCPLALLDKRPGVTVGGKTGTAQSDRIRNPYAWFTAWADDPHVAVCAFVEDAEIDASEIAGGRVAAPIAKAVIEALR